MNTDIPVKSGQFDEESYKQHFTNPFCFRTF